MKKIIVVTVGETEEDQGISSHGLSPHGENQVNELLYSEEWEKLAKPETIYIGQGRHYSQTAEILGLHIPTSHITVICGGLHLKIEAMEELVNSLGDYTLIIVDPDFISPSVGNAMLLEVTIDPEKGYKWPLQKDKDFTVLYSDVPVFSIL